MGLQCVWGLESSLAKHTPPGHPSCHTSSHILSHLDLQIDEELHKILARTVGEAMTKEVISIGPGATMSDAAQLMLAKKVRRRRVPRG